MKEIRIIIQVPDGVKVRVEEASTPTEAATRDEGGRLGIVETSPATTGAPAKAEADEPLRCAKCTGDFRGRSKKIYHNGNTYHQKCLPKELPKPRGCKSGKTGDADPSALAAQALERDKAAGRITCRCAGCGNPIYACQVVVEIEGANYCEKCAPTKDETPKEHHIKYRDDYSHRHKTCGLCRKWKQARRDKR